MHKIDYEKLISIKRDVGWFEKKKEILFEGWPRLYTGVQKKGSKEDRQQEVCSQLWNSNEQDLLIIVFLFHFSFYFWTDEIGQIDLCLKLIMQSENSKKLFDIPELQTVDRATIAKFKFYPKGHTK